MSPPREQPILHSALVALFAAAVAGCGPVIVEGWSVSCETTPIADTAACEAIAAVALNNLGRSRPPEPLGVITVHERRTCPVVPEWADASRCWQAVIPLGPGLQPACMVFARRPHVGGYGRVAGDQLSGLALDDPQPGCPVE